MAAFAEAGPVDYDLILDIIDYFLDYPDLMHHPKEDLIYQKLREREPGSRRKSVISRRSTERSGH